MTWVKVCGLSRPEEVEAAVAAGADAIGFVFYAPSPRNVTPGLARSLGESAGALTVAVTVGLDADSLLHLADVGIAQAPVQRQQLLRRLGDVDHHAPVAVLARPLLAGQHAVEGAGRPAQAVVLRKRGLHVPGDPEL